MEDKELAELLAGVSVSAPDAPRDTPPPQTLFPGKPSEGGTMSLVYCTLIQPRKSLLPVLVLLVIRFLVSISNHVCLALTHVLFRNTNVVNLL